MPEQYDGTKQAEKLFIGDLVEKVVEQGGGPDISIVFHPEDGERPDVRRALREAQAVGCVLQPDAFCPRGSVYAMNTAALLPKMVSCSHCGGIGEFELHCGGFPEEVKLEGLKTWPTGRMPCGACGGTGKIEEP